MQVLIGGLDLRRVVEELNRMKLCPYCYSLNVHIVHHGPGMCGYCNIKKCDRDHDHGMCDACLSDWIERVYEIPDQ